MLPSATQSRGLDEGKQFRLQRLIAIVVSAADPVFIPRFRLASSSRVMRALRQALETAGGYTLALDDPSSAVEVFVDIVIFREALSKTPVIDEDGQVGKSAVDRATVARTMLESVEASFCMVLEGNDTYLTSNVRPLIEMLLERASGVVVGVVWRTERPEAPSHGWQGLRLWLRGLFPQNGPRDALSGLFVLEGEPAAAPKATYFVAKNRSTP